MTTELFYVFWTPITRVDLKCRPKGGDFFPALFISKLDIYLSNFSAICERASFLPQISGRENILQFRMPLWGSRRTQECMGTKVTFFLIYIPISELIQNQLRKRSVQSSAHSQISGSSARWGVFSSRAVKLLGGPAEPGTAEVLLRVDKL